MRFQLLGRRRVQGELDLLAGGDSIVVQNATDPTSDLLDPRRELVQQIQE